MRFEFFKKITRRRLCFVLFLGCSLSFLVLLVLAICRYTFRYSGDKGIRESDVIPYELISNEEKWEILRRGFLIPSAVEFERPVTVFLPEGVGVTETGRLVERLRKEGFKEIAVVVQVESDVVDLVKNANHKKAKEACGSCCLLSEDDLRKEHPRQSEVARQLHILGEVCHSGRWRHYFENLNCYGYPCRFLPAIFGKVQVERLEPETCILATGRSLALKKGRYQWYLRIEDNPEAARRGVETLTVAEAREFVRDLQAKAREIRCRHEILVKDSWTGRNRFRISPKGKELFEFDVWQKK